MYGQESRAGPKYINMFEIQTVVRLCKIALKYTDISNSKNILTPLVDIIMNASFI